MKLSYKQVTLLLSFIMLFTLLILSIYIVKNIEAVKNNPCELCSSKGYSCMRNVGFNSNLGVIDIDFSDLNISNDPINDKFKLKL